MPEPTFMQRLLREKALSRYLTALERGDIDTIIAMLRQSSQDAMLEQMIFELHETYQTEEEFLAMVQEEQEMDFKEGIHKSLPQEELDELGETESQPAPHKSSRYGRWVQVLAAILLIACLSGGVLVYTRLHGTSAQVANSSLYHWCTSAGAPLGATDLPGFYSIAVASPDDVWIVGQDQLPNQNVALFEHWNGKNWSVVHDAVPSPNQNTNQDTSINGVDALSANDVWAVGSISISSNSTYTQQPLVEQWNGQKWHVVSSPGPAGSWLNAVSATSDSDLWAIGGVYIPAHDATSASSSQHLLMHWDGSQWSIPQLPAALHDSIILSVKALAPNDVWLVGSTGQTSQGPSSDGNPLLAHWDGQNWTVASLPSSISSKSGHLYDLSAISTKDVWAAGSSGSGQNASSFILHWDGAAWTQMATPAAGNGSVYVGGLVATGARSLWLVGSMHNNGPSQLLVAHWDGQRWETKLQQPAGDKFLSRITVSGARVWVIGAGYNQSTNTTENPFIETNC